MRKCPHEFDRRILIATMGLFPQIVVESFYALTMQEDPPFQPTEVHILSTQSGIDRAKILTQETVENPLIRLASDFSLEGVKAVQTSHLHVLRDQKGDPLKDINSVEDNTAAADQISCLVQSLTAEDNTALHVSLAGGRKTMGFFLGYSLSLFGRPQDRLSHVLIDPQLESHPEFYYPRPVPEKLRTRDGETVLADCRVVSLADIPFVRLREGLPESLVSGDVSYSGAIARADQLLRPAHMEVDVAEQTVRCQGVRIRLSAAEFAFFVTMVEARKGAANGHGALRWDEFPVLRYLEIYEASPVPLRRTIEAVRRDGIDAEWFSMRCSRSNAAIRKALDHGADKYVLRSIGKRPHTRMGFALPTESINLRS